MISFFMFDCCARGEGQLGISTIVKLLVSFLNTAVADMSWKSLLSVLLINQRWVIFNQMMITKLFKIKLIRENAAMEINDVPQCSNLFRNKVFYVKQQH